MTGLLNFCRQSLQQIGPIAVVHPYSMVKDHRTSHETGNVQAVMDGDLDGFIEAYLKNKAGV